MSRGRPPTHTSSPVQRRRRELGWSASTLAGIVGCSPGTVQDIECARRRPSVSLLKDLRFALGDELVGVVARERRRPKRAARAV